MFGGKHTAMDTGDLSLRIPMTTVFVKWAYREVLSFPTTLEHHFTHIIYSLQPLHYGFSLEYRLFSIEFHPIFREVYMHPLAHLPGDVRQALCSKCCLLQTIRPAENMPFTKWQGSVGKNVTE